MILRCAGDTAGGKESWMTAGRRSDKAVASPFSSTAIRKGEGSTVGVNTASVKLGNPAHDALIVPPNLRSALKSGRNLVQHVDVECDGDDGREAKRAGGAPLQTALNQCDRTGDDCVNHTP